MNDKQFGTLLNKLSTANSKYKRLLREAENEIEARYGVSPSDCDNDSWIDTFHVGTGNMKLSELDKSMKEAIDYYKAN